MKRYLKQYWWLILIIAVAIILPVVIVPCSNNDSNVLSYYGGVVGGILAIIGVFFTVRYSLHFAPSSGHGCVCQRTLGGDSGQHLPRNFPLDHDVVMLRYPLQNGVG